MKISRLIIPDFQQFKDFDLDLTYPQGHEKAGEPLDKVCFIGGNGTGKTTLLKCIADFIADRSKTPEIHYGAIWKVKIDKQYFYAFSDNPYTFNFEIEDVINEILAGSAKSKLMTTPWAAYSNQGYEVRNFFKTNTKNGDNNVFLYLPSEFSLRNTMLKLKMFQSPH